MLDALATACAVAMVLAVLLAACGRGSDDGGTDNDGTTASGDPVAETKVAPADRFPVTVEHELGSTTIETAPEKVVVVGITEQDFLLALGVIPVATTEWYGEMPGATWPWAQDELGGNVPEVLKTTDGFEYERIKSLDPDLIIGTNAGLDEESYERLSKIAPTVAHPSGQPAYFGSWDAQMTLIGEAVGFGPEAEQVVADTEALFTEARDAHPEWEGKQAVLLQNAYYDGAAVAYQDGLSTAFLTDLGFEVPSELEEFASEEDFTQAYIPIERLSVLDVADVLIWATEDEGDVAELEKASLFRTLEEVENGDVVYTDGLTAGAIYFTSPLSLPYVIERLVPAFEQVDAGEGPVQLELPEALAEQAEQRAAEGD